MIAAPLDCAPPKRRATGLLPHGLPAGLCALLLTLLLLTSGCTGSGRFELTSLDFKAVDPPAPRVSSLKVRECYWWTDPDGNVWLAMQRRITPWFSPRLRFEFQLSLALEKPPAGKARNYDLRRRALRARVKFGPWESRFASQIGIAALYRESGNRLRGSLRVQTTQTSLQFLGGWSKPVRHLMLGSFTAVHDEQRGRAIAQITESAGWDRDTPPPTSQPLEKPLTAEQKP